MNLVELWILLSLLITIHIPQIIANILLNGRQRAVYEPLSLSNVVCSRDGREYGWVELVVCPACAVGRVRPGGVVGPAVVEEAWSAVGHCYFWVWVIWLVDSLILNRNGEAGGLWDWSWRKFMLLSFFFLERETCMLCDIGMMYSRRRRNNIEQVDKE